MYFPTGLEDIYSFEFLRLYFSDDLSPECEKLVGRKRIRKEVNRLTPKEKFHLNFAMKLAMASPPYYPKNRLVFKDIANYHGAPYTICTHPDRPEWGRPCCPHADRLPEFLVWHRLYTGKDNSEDEGR